jgi:hypothetical protein
MSKLALALRGLTFGALLVLAFRLGEVYELGRQIAGGIAQVQRLDDRARARREWLAEPNTRRGGS